VLSTVSTGSSISAKSTCNLIYLHCYIVTEVGATLSEVVFHISLANMSSVRVRGQRIARVDNTSAKTSAMKRDSRKTKKDDVDSKSIGANGAVGLALADHKSDQITLNGDQCGDCGKVVSDDRSSGFEM